MNTSGLILVLLVSVAQSLAEPPANTYLPASRSFSRPSTQYGIPSSRFNSISSRYGAPSSRAPSFSSSQNSISGVYGAPSFGRQPGLFGSQSSLGGPSNRYGVPGFQSSGGSRYSSTISPSSQYGAPSQGYSGAGLGGGPSAAGGYNRGGYSQGDDQSEPANYQFSYDVSAPEYGVEFGHAENRQGDDTKGTYYVLLPDGRRQRVDYTADQDGYKPNVSYEDTGAGGRGAYNGGGYQQTGGAGGYSSGRYNAGGYQQSGRNFGSGGYQSSAGGSGPY